MNERGTWRVSKPFSNIVPFNALHNDMCENKITTNESICKTNNKLITKMVKETENKKKHSNQFMQ